MKPSKRAVDIKFVRRNGVQLCYVLSISGMIIKTITKIRLGEKTKSYLLK